MNGETGTGGGCQGIAPLVQVERPFIALNRYYPRGLLESELFGHERGLLRELKFLGKEDSNKQTVERCFWMK